jgi:YHS domain-containing protein
MNARTVRKAISVALLTAAVGLIFEQGSAPQAQQPGMLGKAFANNPRQPKPTTSGKKGKPKVEVTPNPESPYFNGGGKGYVATPPSVPAQQPSSQQPGNTAGVVTAPSPYRPATPAAGQGTLSLQQQQMQAQQMRAAEQYAQQQAAQQQMAQQQRLAQQQMTGQPVAAGQAPVGQPVAAPVQYTQPQVAQGQVAQPAVAQPAVAAGQPQAGAPDSAAKVHDYVAEMYRRDGRDIAQWDYQAMGYNPQPVYKQQGAQGSNAPRQPSFLQRWVPGYSRLFPGRPDRSSTQQAQTAPQQQQPQQQQPAQVQQVPGQQLPGQQGYAQPGYAQGAPAQPQYQQPAQPQFAQPQSAQPQYGQPQYGQPQYGQPQYGQPAPQLLPQATAPQVAGPSRPGTLAPGGQSTSPLVGRVGVPVARPGLGQPVLTPPPALAARPATEAPPQPLPQPEIPGVAPQLTPPANAVVATPPANAAGPQLPVLDIVNEPAPKTAAAPAKSLENDLFLDEAAADQAEAEGSLVLSDDKPKTGTPGAAPAANAPLLADEPVVEKPKENPYTGRKLEVDERVAVVLPNPAASLLDDEEDEDRRMLLADASPGLATVSGADTTPPAPLPTQNPTPSLSTDTTANTGEATLPDAPPDDREEAERPKLAARPALKGFKGFCPVTLRNSRRLVEAKLEYSSEYAGQSYQFATAEAKAEFDAAPDRFVPAKGGRDVVQASAASEAEEGSLDHAVWYRGKLYLFATPATREQFVVEPAKFAVP